MQPRVLEVGPLLRRRHAHPVRRICLRLGTSCPNRDGTLGHGGCVYCGEPAHPLTALADQLACELGRLQPGSLAIAYLQDHTATHLAPARLDALLQALHGDSRIVGIALGTRPDALGPPILDVLHRHARSLELLVEVGLQSADDEVLRFARRMHDVDCFARAVDALHGRGLRVGAHVILGLPRPRADGALEAEGPAGAAATARLLGELRVEAVKIHNCHVLRSTGLAKLFEEGLYRPPDLDGYLERLLAFLEHLPRSVEVHRLCGEARPPALLAPAFTAEKSRTLQRIRAALAERDSWQGKLVS